MSTTRPASRKQSPASITTHIGALAFPGGGSTPSPTSTIKKPMAAAIAPNPIVVRREGELWSMLCAALRTLCAQVVAKGLRRRRSPSVTRDTILRFSQTGPKHNSEVMGLGLATSDQPTDLQGSAQPQTRRIVMATNLVSLIMQFLTPDIVARIAATLGLGRTEAQAGVSAAVPALLAAFSGVADKPGGSQSLADAIKNQSGVLDNVASMVGGGSPSSLVEKGSTLLSSLIGGHDQSALAGAVGKFAGIGQNTGNSLIGMLAPVIMGVIGKQIGSRSLDAGSVGGLLASQKEQIAQALPQGFGRLLGDTGILDSLDGAAETAAATAGQAGRAANAAAAQVGSLAHPPAAQLDMPAVRSPMPHPPRPAGSIGRFPH